MRGRFLADATAHAQPSRNQTDRRNKIYTKQIKQNTLSEMLLEIMQNYSCIFFRAGPGGSLRLILVNLNEIIYPDDIVILIIACESTEQNVLHLRRVILP